MSCEEFKTIYCNTSQTINITLTDRATDAAINGKDVTWQLSTLAGVELASGAAVDSGAAGLFTIAMTLAQSTTMTSGTKYRFIVSIAAEGFNKWFTPEAVIN